MWINKIFSNYEDGENLYNVIMNKDEVALFSEKKNELTKDEKNTIWLQKHLNSSFGREIDIKNLDPDISNEERKKIRRKQYLSFGIPMTLLGGQLCYNYNYLLKNKKISPMTAIAKGMIPAAGLSYAKLKILNNEIDQTDNETRKKKADLIRIANNDMTEHEYINKYHKN